MRLHPAVLLTLAASWAASGQPYTISTFAGGRLPVNIPGTSANLFAPAAVTVDAAGNVFFVDGHDVLRLDAKTGALTVVAGNGTPGFSGDDGLATNAQFDDPQGLAIDSAGNLYIADGSGSVRKVSNKVITTVAGSPLGPTGGKAGTGPNGDNGPATSAVLSSPHGVAVDSAGNLYIADTNHNRIRKVASGVITTVAGGGFQISGSGPATSAGLGNPQGVAVDSTGNVYIADTQDNLIRKVSNGAIATMAGGGQSYPGDGGPATSAVLSYPLGVAVDSTGNLYIASTIDLRIRKISNGMIATVAGGGGSVGDSGPAAAAQLNFPTSVALDSAGNLYIADTYDSRVRKVSGGVIATVAGGGSSGLGDNGPATSAQLAYPQGVALDSAGNLYIADS